MQDVVSQYYYEYRFGFNVIKLQKIDFLGDIYWDGVYLPQREWVSSCLTAHQHI